MDWWSVHLEARSDGTGNIHEDAVDAFADAVVPHHGVVSAGGIPPRWTATVGVETATATEAVTAGAAIVIRLAEAAGLPEWPVVRADAVREDVLDEELSRPA